MSDKWISVEDRLPEPYRSVELFRPEEGAGEDQIWRGYYSGHSECFYSSEYESPLDLVTDWMPLPEPPKEP